MSLDMKIQNMSFKAGQSLAIVGTNPPNATTFSLNVGLDDQNLALHLNPRFDVTGKTGFIALNSFEKGSWQEELRSGGFSFFRGENFKVIIKFTSKEFSMTLPNGCQITYPNHIGKDEYSYFRFMGDVLIRSIEIY